MTEFHHNIESLGLLKNEIFFIPEKNAIEHFILHSF